MFVQGSNKQYQQAFTPSSVIKPFTPKKLSLKKIIIDAKDKMIHCHKTVAENLYG